MGKGFVIRHGGTNTKLPNFTYSGLWDIKGEKDWELYLFTSGDLTFLSNSGISKGIDVFLVGGGGGGGTGSGGGGGGGGYTKTLTGVTVLKNTLYNIEIGAGGSSNTDGNATKAFSNTVAGGTGGNVPSAGHGGAGGSGGGAKSSNGGSDGADGGGTNGGVGQGTTTREFGESGGSLYAGGGGGAGTDGKGMGGEGGGGDSVNYQKTNMNGKVNTGGGGGAGNSSNAGGTGGSGIVVIRNHREG